MVDKTNHPSILRLKLGGGTRHRIVCAAFASLALEQGWTVADLTTYRPQEGQQLPDVVISKTEKTIDKNGGRAIRKDLRYRVEVIDTSDPIPDGNSGFGFNDVVKIKIQDWIARCLGNGHEVGLKNAESPHPPCYDGLLWLLERSLP